MPFDSVAQQHYMHAHPEILGKTALHEWDEATKGKYQSLPQHVHHEHSYKTAHEMRKKNGK